MANTKAIFPAKLWQIVNNKQLDDAIRWTDDGKSVLVFENELKNLCLGKENHLFYTKQPKSFVRQLHLYGFKKVDKNQFFHPSFCRDKPEFLDRIKRNYKMISSSDDSMKTNEETAKYQDTQSSESSNEPQKKKASLEIQLFQEMRPTEILATNHNINNNQLVGSVSDINPILDNFVIRYNPEQNSFNDEYMEFRHLGGTWLESTTTRGHLNYNYNEDNILTQFHNVYPDTNHNNNIIDL